MFLKAKNLLQSINTGQKRIQALAVMIIAVLIALAGTFAWYSFNQRKQNIFNLISAPNVNLHDDFAGGPKKDVYVENSGISPVLVRVRLTELLNTGGRLLPPNAVDNESRENWHLHTPSADSCETCTFEAHKYYTWAMGGQKFYMPAHKSAKGSRSEEGVYAEPVAVGEKEKIIDYGALLTNAFKEIYASDHETLNTILGYMSEYLSGDNTNAAFIKAEIAKIPDSYTVNAVKQYEQQPKEEYIRKLNEVSLTLIPTQIIPIYDWIIGTTYGEPRKTGNFWVMDSDGWCYWAGALEQNQATGLLLSSVTYGNFFSGGHMLYKINVQLNASTFAGLDLNTFFVMAQQNGGISESAIELMFLSSGNYVRGTDGSIYLNEGDGLYRKIEKNPHTSSYINYVLGEQIYVGQGGEPGGDEGIVAGGTYKLGENGALTEDGGGEAYVIENIVQGKNRIVYLETASDVFLSLVDKNGNPDNNGDKFAIIYSGEDGAIGTSDDIVPGRTKNNSFVIKVNR